MSKLMVAVPASQAGARRNRFDESRFLREVVTPVKEFLEVTRGTCPVLLIFFAGKSSECEEGFEVPLPEENVCLGTPSYVAAEKYFAYEFRMNRVWMHTLLNPEPGEYEAEVRRLMADHGAEKQHILPPTRLKELAEEVMPQAA